MNVEEHVRYWLDSAGIPNRVQRIIARYLSSLKDHGFQITDKNKIRKITISISTDLEVLPFNPRDFTPSDPLVKEILETGVRVM